MQEKYKTIEKWKQPGFMKKNDVYNGIWPK